MCPLVSVCISQHTHINRCKASSRLFRVLHNRVQRHRGIFWLHLHVKWSALFCGREVPPDSPSPVACQTEQASSPHSSLPAGMGHDSTVRNILWSCQSLHCPTGVSLLKSSRLARTNKTHSQRLPSARREKKSIDKILKKLPQGSWVSNVGIAMLLALYKYLIKQK